MAKYDKQKHIQFLYIKKRQKNAQINISARRKNKGDLKRKKLNLRKTLEKTQKISYNYNL